MSCKMRMCERSGERRVVRCAAVAIVATALGCGDGGGVSRPVPAPPDQPGASAPRLAPSDDGALLSWLEPDAGGHAMRVARFGSDRRWIDLGRPVSSDDLFVNWADVPQVAQTSDGGLIAGWLQKSGPETYSYDVRLARLAPGSSEWAALGKLNDDDLRAEHGFVSFARHGDAQYAFWLDGRETAAGSSAGSGGHGDGAHSGAMTLRAARIGDAVEPSVLLDDSVCDCCPTAAATTQSGAIVVYRDRTADEVRDIACVRLTAAGFSEPAIVAADRWKIEGCPVNGPAVAARDEQVAVAWYTEAFAPLVQVAFSNDAGVSFGPPIAVDPRGEGTSPLGRVDVQLDQQGAAWVLWMTTREDQTAIKLRRVEPNARVGDEVLVALTSPERRYGYPRIEWHGGELLVVWVDAFMESNGTPSTRLRGVRFLPPDAGA